jgi:chromosome segregation ATPase
MCASLTELSGAIQLLQDWKVEETGNTTKLSSEVEYLNKKYEVDMKAQEAIRDADIAKWQQKLDDAISALCMAESRVCAMLLDADKSQRSSEDYIARIAALESKLREANGTIEVLQRNEVNLTQQLQEVHTAFLDADDKRNELEMLVRILSDENAKAKHVNDGLYDRISDCAPIELLSKDNLR